VTGVPSATILESDRSAAQTAGARCGAVLPCDANARRRYCSPACVARACRARRRTERAKQVQTLVVHAYATAFVPDAMAAELISAAA
jgi:hypothetical protein